MTKLYTKGSTVTDEILSGAERYDIKEDAGTAYKTNMQVVLATPVAVAGTVIDAARINNMEDGIDVADTILSNAGLNNTDALTPANDDILQRKSGKWVNRTIAQYITDLTAGLSALFIKVDGWISDSNTWTRTGNHTFTITGNATAYLTKGTFVKYTDSTPSTDYGVIYSSVYASGTTTVTLITNTKYSMSAGAITSTYYSYMANPAGWPGSFNFTPTTSYPNVTIHSAKYFTVANSLSLIVDVEVINNSGGSFPFQVGAPCNLLPSGATGVGREDNLTGAMLQFYQYYNPSVIAVWGVSVDSGHRYKISISNLFF